MVRAAIALILLMLASSASNAEKRVALLIGNQSYGSEIGRLANPHNDVALLERSLKGLGFEVVTVRDAGQTALTRAVNSYARRVQAAGPNAVGFFYYSGHGAADAGTNYLIPVDASTTETGELWDQSLRLTEITRKLKAEAGNATHFVVFDACRNTLKLTKAGSRAVVQSKGFVPVTQESGMLIAYATAEGELASDVGAGAGPYAKVLAEEIVKPGVEAVVMFRVVQRRVRAAIRQEPYLGFNAMGDVYLAGAETPKPQLLPEVSEAAREWARVDKTSVVELETFVRRHAKSPEAEYARAYLEQHKQQVSIIPVPIPAATKSSSERGGQEKTSVAMQGDPLADLERVQRCDGTETLVGNERRCLKPKDTFKDCSECPEMVVIPAGEYMMGSNDGDAHEKPMHKVTIARPFGVGKFELTFAEWDACVVAGGCKHRPEDQGWGRGRQPVINVSWDHATKEYMPWLSRTAGKTYRLPTEAEWEYAARGEATEIPVVGVVLSPSNYPWGMAIGENRANCRGCGSQWDLKQTAPVGLFAANAFGLHDMHGNVWEWVQDCYKDTYAGVPPDGRATSDVASCLRVVRGGSFNVNPQSLRSAGRGRNHPHDRSGSIGLRVARTLD